MPLHPGLLASAQKTADHPARHNFWGASVINSISRVHDVNDELYLWARSTDFIMAQLVGMISSSDRATNIPKWQSINDSNPLAFVAFHQITLSETPAFRQKNDIAAFYYYDTTLGQERGDGIVHVDHDDIATKVNFRRASASSSTAVQAAYQYRFIDLPSQNAAADYAHDLVTGGNLTGLGVGGADISEFAGWWHDNTGLQHPANALRLLNTQSDGDIVSIISAISGGTHLKEVRINKQPNLPTTGTTTYLGTDYGTVDTVENVDFHDGLKDFIGYHIIGYLNRPAGESDLLLKDFPGSAHATQTIVPVAGWNYSISNFSSGTNSIDWDADGIRTSKNAALLEWAPSWHDYLDKIASRIKTTANHDTLRGWNGISGSYNLKKNNGWVDGHALENSADSPAGEHMQVQFGFVPKPDTGPHEYDCSSTDIEEGMKALSFGRQWLRLAQSAWARSKTRGVNAEFEPWGDDYTDVTAVDATYARFFLAVARDIPDIVFNLELEGKQSVPFATEELWLDFYTNRSLQALIYTYDSGGGPVGPDGPKGSGVWAPVDFGERGYIRRDGNFARAMNCADAPAGYNTYAPTHLPSPFTARDPQDIIKPADFTALYTSGLLKSGETLKHIDFSTYVNQRVTDWLLANATTYWTGHKYGPQQSHPNDGDGAFTVATLPLIARDPTRNDGSAVNQSVDYILGPMEAVFWEIV